MLQDILTYHFLPHFYVQIPAQIRSYGFINVVQYTIDAYRFSGFRGIYLSLAVFMWMNGWFPARGFDVV